MTQHETPVFVAGIFAMYAFIASSLNKDKEIINQDVSLFAAWVFTFFVFHNAWNYACNAWEQFKLEGCKESKKSGFGGYSEWKDYSQLR